MTEGGEQIKTIFANPSGLAGERFLHEAGSSLPVDCSTLHGATGAMMELSLRLTAH